MPLRYAILAISVVLAGLTLSACSDTAPQPSVVATAMPPPPVTLEYDRHQTAGRLRPGGYAFLSDPNDLESKMDRYEHEGTFGFLIHQSDAASSSQAAFFQTVVVGDVFDWWRGDDCYSRLEVKELRPDPATTPARKLFVVSYRHSNRTDCDGPNLTDATQSVEFRWRPLPYRLGPDGIRIVIGHEPVTGPGRYRLSSGSEVVITVPDGMTIQVLGSYSDGKHYNHIVDVETGARLYVDADTGRVAGRRGVPAGEGASGANDGARNVGDLFDLIEASIETPGWGGQQ
ncbi:MAG: hypothetical protein F4X76_00230 [Chloroflexi bacterium]|nr:hypothetical protein [Chloroflexota bacterium]